MSNRTLHAQVLLCRGTIPSARLHHDMASGEPIGSPSTRDFTMNRQKAKVSRELFEHFEHVFATGMTSNGSVHGAPVLVERTPGNLGNTRPTSSGYDPFGPRWT